MAFQTGHAGPPHAVLGRNGSIAAALGQTLVLFTLTTLPTPLYGDYAKAFHFSVFTLTLIYAVYVAGTLSVLFSVGRLSDQIGRRPVCLMAVGMALLSALLLVFARNTAMLFAGRFVTGLAAGLSSGTAIAWLRDLYGSRDQKAGSVQTVAVNVLGLGIGPLFCGLAAPAAGPSFVPYAIYIVFLAPLALAVWSARETVKQPRRLAQVRLGLRVGVPANCRAQFLAPGLITFVLYSLVGFYSALVPNLLAHVLHLTSHLVSGPLIFAFFLAAALVVVLLQTLSSRTAMLWGAALMLPALVLLVLAETQASLAALIAGTLAGGISLGIGYRGAIEVATKIAPPDHRAELLSMIFVCGNLGLAIPVIGVGLLSALTRPALAEQIFAGVIALLSLAGLGFGLIYTKN
jgi:MFS family permease